MPQQGNGVCKIVKTHALRKSEALLSAQIWGGEKAW